MNELSYAYGAIFFVCSFSWHTIPFPTSPNITSTEKFFQQKFFIKVLHEFSIITKNPFGATFFLEISDIATTQDRIVKFRSFWQQICIHFIITTHSMFFNGGVGVEGWKPSNH